MKTYYQGLVNLLFLMGILSWPALADTQFQIRRMTRQDVAVGTGQCDIRVMIDQEAEVSVSGDTVHIRNLQGRDGRDAGSECNVSLPARGVEGFDFQVLDRRGDIALLSDPSRGSRVVVRIRDNEGGEGRYHFRLSWVDRGYTTNDGRNDRGNDRNNPRRGGYGRGGRWGSNRGSLDNTQGIRMSSADAVNMCGDAARDRIYTDYRLDNVQIQNVAPDSRTARNELINGLAVGRSGANSQRFQFACRVNYSTGAIQSLDITRR